MGWLTQARCSSTGFVWLLCGLFCPGLTPLHCAALAHTVLVTESQKTDIDTDMGRFLRLRKDQILEGINCLLQMGGKPELQVRTSSRLFTVALGFFILCNHRFHCHLQVLNSCQITTASLKIEENTELMCLLQTHKPKGQNILQEVTIYSYFYTGSSIHIQETKCSNVSCTIL